MDPVSPYVSPYSGLSEDLWIDKTKELIANHPLDTNEIVEVVLDSWQSIFKSQIGSKGFTIGEHLQPAPQIMGFFLHELIPLEFEARYPGKWRRDKSAKDKDLVYLPDLSFSVEIKTSSSTNKIYGNRSYAQESEAMKKSKSGYYLAVNFEKFSSTKAPEVRLIRFGWLDHSDWIGQSAATGQQARLSPATELSKLLPLFRSEQARLPVF